MSSLKCRGTFALREPLNFKGGLKPLIPSPWNLQCQTAHARPFWCLNLRQLNRIVIELYLFLFSKLAIFKISKMLNYDFPCFQKVLLSVEIYCFSESFDEFLVFFLGPDVEIGFKIV